MSAMPAITLWQPWASLVAAGAKPFEFRSWPAPKRLIDKRVAIHASARPVKTAELQELMLKLEGPNRRETGLRPGPALDLLERAWNAKRWLPLSSVVCTVTLGQPIRNKELAARLGVAWTNDSDRDEHSNWGWPLTDVKRLEPMVPARGAQGWWLWTPPEGCNA